MTDSYAVLAPYYEMMSETRDWDGWIRYVHRVLQDALPHQQAAVLDAACGTGRIGLALATLGYDVVGVDASPAMLRQAKKAAMLHDTELLFVQQDLRQLALEQRFHAVICLCDSLNYLVTPADLQLAMQRVSRHLHPGGHFLFDINTEWKLENVYGDFAYGAHYDDVSYVWENSYEPSQRTVTMEMAFFLRQPDGTYQRYDETHVQRAHTHMDILSALDRAGLVLQDFGKILGHQPPEPVRERVFYLAKRPL